MTFFLKFILFF